ncbi:MAG: GGDEF domain-containing protein, partial [Myxococcales bacterium]|nr:GGDEF domain-containing protein [Myxococcales bacterium]
MPLQASAERLQYVAGWSRVVLGLVAMLLLPLLYPGFETQRWLFGGYVAFALVGQGLIYKGIGGPVRSFVGGVVDMAAVTFLVHRVGSMGTMLVAIYYFGAIVNTLVVGRRVGVGLALAASIFYSAVVLWEQAGLLPYGPNAPAWAAMRPGHTDAAVGATLFAATLLGSAGLVGLLATRIREREAELRALAGRLEALSQRDPLTHLFNRRYLMQRLETELARVRRGSPMAVLMIDLDKFKRVNDEQGHQMGDEILVAIAAALAEATREVDVPGRYGGDEF